MNKLQFEEKYITPKMAEALLQKNETNRTLSLKTVEAYAEDMRQGHWDYRSDCGISIDSEGILRDGQHRLNAIIKYGKPVKFAKKLLKIYKSSYKERLYHLENCIWY